MTMRIDLPRRLCEVAKLAEVSTETMRRRLRALERTEGHPIMTRSAGPNGQPVYWVTLADLRKAWPEFGKKYASANDVLDLKDVYRQLRRDLNLLAVSVREVKNDVTALMAASASTHKQA